MKLIVTGLALTITIVLIVIAVVLIDHLLLPRLPEHVQGWWIYLTVTAVIIVGVLGSVGSILSFLGYSLSDFLPQKNDDSPLIIKLDYHAKGPRPYGTSFEVTVVNKGGSPATIKEISILLENDGTIYFSHLRGRNIKLYRSTNLPKKLEQSDSQSFWFPFYHMLHDSNVGFTNPMQVILVTVTDSYGVEHEYPGKDVTNFAKFQKLREEVQSSWSEIDWITQSDDG